MMTKVRRTGMDMSALRASIVFVTVTLTRT